MMRRYQLSLILAILLTIFVPTHASQVVVLPYSGAIGPVSQLQLTRAISDAKSRDAEALIIELNTPGGLMSTTREMVQIILNAPIPVVVYVSPRGAHAGSAGVFITMSAHFAAMAPGTNIGAAHPVNMGSKDSISGPMRDKVLNDAVAQIKTIARQRNRNVEWAESAVRQSVSVTEQEADSLQIVDFVVSSFSDLLDSLDGKSTTLANGSLRTLHTKNVSVVRRTPGLGDALLEFLSNPNLAYILMALGFYGLLFELQNPGAIWPGVIGGLSLILAFTAFQVLPINLSGLILIIIAFVLFILEVKIISKGAFTVGGIIALIAGSLMLFEMPDDMPGLSWSVIAGVVVTTVLFFLLLVGASVKALKGKISTGAEGMIGEEGETLSEMNPEGTVFVHGEYWNAVTHESLPKGCRIIVEGIDGQRLRVARKE